LLDQPWLYDLFGVAGQPAYAGLVLAALFVLPLMRWSAPIENKLSLKHEREADAFAVDVMGGGDSLADALANLTSENLANPFPHPLYATFHYTHPPIPERIRYIERQGGESEEGATGQAAA
jgi:STE24 endopeptidase